MRTERACLQLLIVQPDAGMWGLEGRTAIVTGAGHGIGKATAELLGTAGVRIVAADVDEAAVKETCRGIASASRAAAPFVADVSDADTAQQLAEFAFKQFGRIDILFANAAIQLVKPMAETSEAEWDRLMDVNLKGVFLCCRAVIPHMRAQRNGAIVISSSGHAFATYRGFSAYAAAKGAVTALMRGVALDYAAEGIRANCVIPGATDTRMIQSFFNEASNVEAARRSMEESIPMGRLAAPADIARAVLFLVSDHASYITGTSLAVDGGLMAQG